ncbi:hypothetical protein M5C96_13720 [Acidovorax sp. GBBC 1281]|uniref:hypothetical protein n=1 Tax=Acidovorax sp. GBBC 1281 TaxID=2940492 RepID=UPI002349B7FE|nr:hypothetical protein [Acidovorax sp. GBBC 1281]WCM95549.1 hypothetical protein M5C96_13720 [Acidovorax sp. GBBC 1281]
MPSLIWSDYQRAASLCATKPSKPNSVAADLILLKILFLQVSLEKHSETSRCHDCAAITTPFLINYLLISLPSNVLGGRPFAMPIGMRKALLHKAMQLAGSLTR